MAPARHRVRFNVAPGRATGRAQERTGQKGRSWRWAAYEGGGMERVIHRTC